MKRNFLMILAVLVMAVGLHSCKDAGGSAEIEETDLVESGVYTGIAKEVDDEEQEIYLETTEGQVLELYFTEGTTLLEGDNPVEFENLEQGQNLEVTVEKVGKRLEPVRVVIVE